MNKNTNKESFLEGMLEAGKQGAGIWFLWTGIATLCGTACLVLTQILGLLS